MGCRMEVKPSVYRILSGESREEVFIALDGEKVFIKHMNWVESEKHRRGFKKVTQWFYLELDQSRLLAKALLACADEAERQIDKKETEGI